MTDANRITSSMPVQKTGAEYPITETTVIIWESKPLGRREARTPRVVPTSTATSNDERTSSSVAGSRSRMSCVTGRLKN